MLVNTHYLLESNYTRWLVLYISLFILHCLQHVSVSTKDALSWRCMYVLCVCVCVCVCIYIYIYIIFIVIGIQPLARSGQRPEFSQTTGMALVRCILGKFLGVDCHCFPPLFRCSHFSPPGSLHVRHDVRDPSGGSGNCGPARYP